MSKGRGNVKITGIGSYKPPHRITNEYLFENFLSPVPYRQLIRKGAERLFKGKYEEAVKKAIDSIEDPEGLGVRGRWWEVLPAGENTASGYISRVRDSDKRLSRRLFHDPSNTKFKDGWEYITKELNLTDDIDPESHTDSAMGLKAAKMALYTADIDPKKIGLVVHGTATPDALGGYSTAGRIAHSLGIPKDASAYDIITGCSAAFDTIALGKSYLMDPDSNVEAVLVTSSNFTSNHVKGFFNGKPRGWKAPRGFPGFTSIVLFGDGAGAYVLERAKDDDGTGIIHMKKIYDAEENPALCLEGGSASPLTKKSIDLALEQYYVHHGIVKKKAPRLMREVAEKTAEEAHKLGYGDYHPSKADLVIAHQASKGTLYAAQNELGIDPHKMVNEVETRGNLVGASIPIAHTIALDRIKPDDNIHLLTIGGGWHAGDAIIKIGPEIEKIKERRNDYKKRNPLK